MIIKQVNNKIFIVPFTKENLVIDTNTSSISTSFLKNTSLIAVSFFFQFQHRETS